VPSGASFPAASWLVCRALIDEVDLIGEGTKLTQLSCTFALSFSVLWFPCFPDYASPMLSCWTLGTIRACRPQRKRPAWWSMSSMVRAVRIPPDVHISDIATLSVCLPVLFGSGMMWCVLHRREPRGDAEEQRDPDEWQQAEQSTGPPPGHGGQFRRPMAYWWTPHRHRHQQQLPGFLLEFIHSAYQL